MHLRLWPLQQLRTRFSISDFRISSADLYRLTFIDLQNLVTLPPHPSPSPPEGGEGDRRSGEGVGIPENGNSSMNVAMVKIRRLNGQRLETHCRRIESGHPG